MDSQLPETHHVHLNITQPDPALSSALKPSSSLTLSRCRINEAQISQCLQELDSDSLHETDVFLCGPPTMVDGVAMLLHRLGVPQARVFYERWW